MPVVRKNPKLLKNQAIANAKYYHIRRKIKSTSGHARFSHLNKTTTKNFNNIDNLNFQTIENSSNSIVTSKISLRTIGKEKYSRKQNLLKTNVELEAPEGSITGPLRAPTLTEKSEVLRRIFRDQKCPKCHEIIKYDDIHKDPFQIKNAVVKHGLKKHLTEEMKVCYNFTLFILHKKLSNQTLQL